MKYGWSTDGVRKVYARCTDIVRIVYGSCTDVVRILYGWCTSIAALEEIWCLASGTKAPSGHVFPNEAEMPSLASSAHKPSGWMLNSPGRGFAAAYPSAADAAATDFGVRREAKRHAALGTRPGLGKRCRRYALPPQSISLPSVRGVAGLQYGWPPDTICALVTLALWNNALAPCEPRISIMSCRRS